MCGVGDVVRPAGDGVPSVVADDDDRRCLRLQRSNQPGDCGASLCIVVQTPVDCHAELVPHRASATRYVEGASVHRHALLQRSAPVAVCLSQTWLRRQVPSQRIATVILFTYSLTPSNYQQRCGNGNNLNLSLPTFSAVILKHVVCLINCSN